MAGFDDPGIAMSYVKSLRKSGHKQVKLHASEYDMQFLGAASEALGGSRSHNTAVGFALPNDPGEFDGPEEADDEIASAIFHGDFEGEAP